MRARRRSVHALRGSRRLGPDSPARRSATVLAQLLLCKETMKENHSDDGKRDPKTMETFRGLVYVKLGRLGSKSEGPDYFLQTAKAELLLKYEKRNYWMPDYHLEFFNRRMVKVTGSFEDQIFVVRTIDEILSPGLPRPSRVELATRASTQVNDVTIGLSEIRDSRCPTGAVCVRAGEAIAVLWASRGPTESIERFELTLAAGRPELATKTVLGARFTLTEVEPHPTVETASGPKPQTIKLEVEDLHT